MCKVLKSTASTFEKIAASTNSLQQASLAKEMRKKLRAEMEKDNELGALTAKQRAEVARIIEALLSRNTRVSSPARRFIERKLLAVRVNSVAEAIDTGIPPQPKVGFNRIKLDLF